MTIQTINLGNYANDGTGDDLRTAFEKVNSNFDILRYEITGASTLGTGMSVFAQKNPTQPILEFKSLTSIDNSVIMTSPLGTTVNLQAVTKLSSDITPSLGADLNLNGHVIKGNDTGGIESKIWGIDVQLLNAIVTIMVESNQAMIDFGFFIMPTGYVTSANGYTVDFGGFINPPVANNLDFGGFSQVNN